MGMDEVHQKAAITSQHTSALAKHEFLAPSHRPSMSRLHKSSHGCKMILGSDVGDISHPGRWSMLVQDPREQDDLKS